MDKEYIVELLKHPEKVGPADRFVIQEHIEKFPFFQPLRLLLLNSFKEKEHPAYQKALELASIYTANRENLYRFVNQTEFKSSEKVNLESAEIANEGVQAQSETTEPHTVDAPVAPSQTTPTEVVEEQVESTPSESNLEAEVAPLQENEVVETKINEEAQTPENQIEGPTDSPSNEEHEASSEIKHEESISIKANERHAFSEWLSASVSKKPESDPTNKPQEKKKEIISQFLQGPQKISTPKKTESDSAPSLENRQFTLMTETLANIYLEQKKYNRAIKAYEMLKLKYPEKSGFFADQIKKVEKLKKDGSL